MHHLSQKKNLNALGKVPKRLANNVRKVCNNQVMHVQCQSSECDNSFVVQIFK